MVSLREKWSRVHPVSTDSNEQQFYYDNGKRSVREKYTYYYSVADIEEIIGEWVNSTRSNSKIKLDHQIHRIPNADLYKLVSSSVAHQIGQIHQLTIRGVHYRPSSHNNNNNNNKKTALFVGGTHSREVASVSAMIAFVDWLLEDNEGVSSKLLEVWKIEVILLMNPLGYYIDNSETVETRSGELTNKVGIYHRKNDRGVRQFRPGSVPRSLGLVQIETLDPEIFEKGDCGADIPSQLDNYLDSGTRSDDGKDSDNDDDSDKSGEMDGGEETTDVRGYRHRQRQKSREIGVDLNRNSGLDFWCDGRKSNGWVGSGSGETYPGPRANSEPEIQIFQKIFKTVNPDLFITLHGFGNLIVTCDVYDDTHKMNRSQLTKLRQSHLHLSRRKSVRSPYTLSQLVEDFDFFKEITRDVKVWKVAPTPEGARDTGEKIDFPLEVCPLGPATGDMTFWSYCWRQAQGLKNPYIGFTLELGNKRQDLFYPNKYQMIDIIHNSRTILVNALQHH